MFDNVFDHPGAGRRPVELRRGLPLRCVGEKAVGWFVRLHWCSRAQAWQVLVDLGGGSYRSWPIASRLFSSCRASLA